MSTFSVNKSLEEPASGSYTNAWAAPVNANWALIDTCFGGVTSISVTGVVSNITLSAAQYQPPNIELNGVLSVNLVIFVPGGVGGFWSVSNNTTGAHTLAFNCAAGGGVTITQGQRAFVICDGANVALAQSLAGIPFSALSGTIEPGQVTSTSVTQFQNLLAISASQITGTILADQIGFIPAAQITSGVFAAARIPAPASLPGVYIVPDPGGGYIPTGGYGDIFYYY